MSGRLIVTRLRNGTKDALTRENLPYIMGMISLFLMIAAPAISSASASGTINVNIPGSQMSHSTVIWTDGPGYLGGEIYYNSWQEGSLEGESWLMTDGWDGYYGWDMDYGWDGGYGWGTAYGRDLDYKPGIGSWKRPYNRPPEITSLSPDEADSQAAGSKVVWTAKAHDPDGDRIYYKFLLKSQSTGGVWREMTGWRMNNKWTWWTSAADVGNSEISVQIRDGYHVGPNDWDDHQARVYTITGPRFGQPSNRLPTVTNLYPSLTSPQIAGSSIVWTANAQDPDCDRIYYKFLLKGPSTCGVWKDMTGWTASNQWTWSTSTSNIGENEVKVLVRDRKHAGISSWDSYLVREYTITGPGTNHPPVATGLDPDRSGPQWPGSRIRWTANAYDPDGDQIYYRFWLNGPSTGNVWQDMTGWTTNNHWTWSTSTTDIGKSSVTLWIRDANHASSNSWDSYQTRDYTITGSGVAGPGYNRPPSVTCLSSDKPSSQPAGRTITFTADATDPDGDQIYYRFWLKGPSTGDAWKDMTGWTANDHWAWRTSVLDVGNNKVNVWIRDGNHEASDRWDDYKVVDFGITRWDVTS